MICTKFRKEKQKNHPQFYHPDNTVEILVKIAQDLGLKDRNFRCQAPQLF